MSKLCMLTVLLMGGLAAAPQTVKDSQEPCKNAMTTLDMTTCYSDALKAADAELNRVYGQIRAKSAGNENLVASQRAWTKYRDAECGAEKALYEGGTAAGPVHLACRYEMTVERTKLLRKTYRGQMGSGTPHK
jgi:uncharacterized protein YecT (DUF1311 family)